MADVASSLPDFQPGMDMLGKKFRLIAIDMDGDGNLLGTIVDRWPYAVDKGDYVTIGDSDLTWRVEGMDLEMSAACPFVALRSGQTDRLRREPIDNLTLYRKADQ